MQNQWQNPCKLFMQISQAIFLAAPEFVQNQQASNFVQDVFSAFNYFEQLWLSEHFIMNIVIFKKKWRHGTWENFTLFQLINLTRSMSLFHEGGGVRRNIFEILTNIKKLLLPGSECGGLIQGWPPTLLRLFSRPNIRVFCEANTKVTGLGQRVH